MRRPSRSFMVALVLAAGLVAGCNGPGADPTLEPGPDAGIIGAITLLAQDAAGDAYEYNSHWLANSQPCVVIDPPPGPSPAPEVDPLPQGCGTLWSVPAYAGEPRGAMAASPARDVLAVKMQETPTTLEVFLEVAQLREDLAGAIDGQFPGQGTQYGVSWQEAGTGCFLGAFADIQALVNGVFIDTYVGSQGTGCPEQGAPGEVAAGPCRFTNCFWQPQFSIAYGAPATLHWSVPRHDLAAAGVGPAVVQALGITSSFPAQSERTPTVRSTGIAQAAFYPNQQYYLVDVTPPGDFAFEGPAGQATFATLPLHLESSRVLDSPGPGRPDLRFLGVDVADLGDRFQFAAGLELVEDVPRDHRLSVEFGIPGHDAWFGYQAAGGVRAQFATLHSPDGSEVSVPATMTVEAGAPGRIFFEVLRADLPPILGDVGTTVIWADTSLYTDNATAVGDAGVAVSTWQRTDMVRSAPSVLLRESGAEVVAPPGRFPDGLFDVQPPQDLLLAPTSGFDLTGVEILSTRPGEVRISLGVRDLSRLNERPAGYDGVFYAVGIGTETGQTMVGYYRGTEKPAGTFLCAPDTAVLEAETKDPQSSSDWTEIVGRVLRGATGGKGQQQAAGNSAFIMVAPAECFGLERDDPLLNITALQAKVFLIRRAPTGAPVESSMPMLDAAEGKPFLLAFATVPQPAPSFWDAPFGLEQFWNIFGAGLAILTVLGTFVVFLRRRNVMKGYMADIARLEKMHTGEPLARAAALVALRRRLHRDIVSHRVSDSSYILDRMRSSITSARLVTLGESFYDLPTALALRIERLLDDGRLTAEEQSMLEPMVGRAKMPQPGRDRLIQRLQRWVAEDAGTDG